MDFVVIETEKIFPVFVLQRLEFYVLLQQVFCNA